MNHNLESALIGNNYLSYLLSIALLDKGKKIYVLDDDRFNFGEMFSESISHFEVSILKNWINQLQASSSINLDDYLTNNELIFQVGKKKISLGLNPYSNFKELCRKFPEFFYSNSIILTDDNKAESFNNSFYEMINEFTKLSFNENKKSQEWIGIESKIPSDLLAMFNVFFSSLKEFDNTYNNYEKCSELNTLIYMTRGFYHQRVGISANKVEAFHLLCMLLSPHYSIDYNNLNKAFKNIFASHGGEFRKVNLDDLSKSSGHALETFDGMIRPRKLAFIGGYPFSIPLKMTSSLKSRFYECLRVEIEFKEDVGHYFKNNKVILSSPIKIGTARPFWEMKFSDSKKAVFHIVMNHKEGTKISFIQNKIISLLRDDLLFINPDLDFTVVDYKMSFTKDLLVDDFSFYAHKKSNLILKKLIPELITNTNIRFNSKFKNAYYLGPFGENWLGRYSTIMELKRWSQSL